MSMKLEKQALADDLERTYLSNDAEIADICSKFLSDDSES